MDLRQTFDTIGGGAVCSDIESLVRILRKVVVVGDGELICAVEIEVELAEKRIVSDWMRYRRCFIQAAGGADKVSQRQPLTVRIAIDQSFMSWIRNHGSSNWAWGSNCFA